MLETGLEVKGKQDTHDSSIAYTAGLAWFRKRAGYYEKLR